MELTLENVPTIENPDALRIEESLRDLLSKRNDFAILAESAMTYVQAAPESEAGFVLEYQGGSTKRHFRTVRRDVSFDDMVLAFQRYAAGDARWRSQSEWERMDKRAPADLFFSLPFVIVAVVAVAYLIYQLVRLMSSS